MKDFRLKQLYSKRRADKKIAVAIKENDEEALINAIKIGERTLETME